MDSKKFPNKHGPEYTIQAKFIEYLELRGWRVERMIGNQLQMGIPDIYCMHPEFGERWVDLKNPADYEFTKAQRYKWPKWKEHGTGIWIITGWSDKEYAKLFDPPNWEQYWKPKYDEETEELEVALRELFDEYEREETDT
jgi:hypothetical protein